MTKGKYLTVYLGKNEAGLPEALDRLAKRCNITRNQYIRMYLMSMARLSGELCDGKWTL